MDAESDVLLHKLVRQVHTKYPEGQNKLYPISHLKLGPQVNSKEFESVYYRLPNFHPIYEAFDEAFSTGAMGNELDYDFTMATLTACFAHPNRGVMTEIEEDLFEIVQKSSTDLPQIIRDDGDSVMSIDWDRLPGWQEKMIQGVPNYELHHGIDIPKRAGERRPPVDLAKLSQLTNDDSNGNDAAMSTGGWFIFAKEDRWAYRSNEFSNRPYYECKQRLMKQFKRIREHFDSLLLVHENEMRDYKNSASLEKVHAIWRI